MGSVSDHNILRWNDFHNQIAANLQDLRDDDEFVDVTVACDENSQIQAHKLILSACSPYFRALLRKAGPNVPHPILIMPADTRYQDLVSLIDFMYHGEVAIPTEDVTQFLGLAEQFKVKGLYHERPKQPPGQFRPTGAHGPPKAGPSRPPPGSSLPPDIRGRLPPGISMMKSGGASPHKRPRLDHHHPLGPGGPRHHQQQQQLHPHGGSQHDDSVDEVQEIIRDEEDSNDFYSNYGEEYEEGAGWGDGEPTVMQQQQQQQQQPPPPPPGSRGPQLMGLLCPNCRTMCQGVPALKEHMAVCQGAAPGSQPGTSGGHFPPGQQLMEEAQECHVCDKSFKSHRTLDNHMKKQHGISAPPRQPTVNLSRGNRGRPKKPATGAASSSGHHHGGMEGEEGGWGHPHEAAGGYAAGSSGHSGGQLGGPHKEMSARPVGQVAPAQRPLPPTSSSNLQPPKTTGAAVADPEVGGGVVPRSSSANSGPSLAVAEDMRRNQPSPRGSGRGGRGGLPPMAAGRGGHPGGFPRPGSSGGPPMMAGSKSGPSGPASGLGVGSGVTVGSSGDGGSGGGVSSHHPHQQQHTPNRPDLQKLGLKFGGQISITSTGNQGGKRGGPGGVDAQGVSITKLKGDLPVGSPVSIRDATNKQQPQGGQQQQGQGGAGGSGGSRAEQQDGAAGIKEEPGQVKEEPKDFVEGDGLEGEEAAGDPDEEGAGDFGEEEEEEEEYGEGEFEQDDGLYQGDGDFEGMEEGDMEEDEEEEFMEGGRTGMFQGQYGDGYPEIGGDYEEEG